MSDNESNPTVNAQLLDLSKKLKAEPESFNEFESKFISENAERIEIYGTETNFSPRQSQLIEKIHAEKVRGEKAAPVEKLPNAVALDQLKKLAPMVALDADGKFSDFEKDLILKTHEFSKTLGDQMVFSVKQAETIDKIFRQKVLGEKIEKSKSKA